jgi:hypothetical protein
MLRLEKVPRASFFEGWTRGFFLGLLVYVATVLTAYFIGTHTNLDMTLCALNRFLGIPCPLCGGTAASLSLASGRLSDAFFSNPLVSLALPIAGLWILTWVGLGYRAAISIPKPILLPLGLLLIVANWAYVISTHQ